MDKRELAKRYLVGGVNSPVRAFNYVNTKPLLVKNGRASLVYDYNGKAYIDYVLSWGSLILGHAHPEITRDLKTAINEGVSFGMTNAREIELAGIISKAIPPIEKIRFVNSGSEAVMGALRLARGYTKREIIVKFSHSYHGHADYLLAAAGSGLATLKIPQTKGVPADFFKYTIVVPYGNRKALEKIFKQYGRKIAAVIFEPVGANYGVVLPQVDFLKYLRAITRKYGALLVADEVVTGFRFCFGSLALKLGIEPDLIILGKIIGGGLPIGAFGGKEKIMRYLAPQGEVYQASTFAGNPVVMQAGITTLRALEKLKKNYQQLEILSAYLSQRLQDEALRNHLDLQVARFGSIFSFKFAEKKDFVRFYQKMLKHGILFAPSEFEANFLSFAHAKTEIDQTINAAKLALRRS